MFDLIPNAKTRDIIGELSLEQLVSFIKNPSTTSKLSTNTARKYKKGSKEYNRIKVSLPCFIPNYRHDAYVKAETAVKSTGYVYIDIDEEIVCDYSSFSFVAAAWKSLSGIGTSLLVAIDGMPKAGCSKAEIQDVVEQVCNRMELPFDKAAISRDRLVALAYDENIYSNLNHNSFILTNTNSKKKIVKISTINKSKCYGDRLRVNDTFIDDTLRMSNYSEIVETIKFEEGEIFKDFSDNKVKYAEVFIPKTIKNGDRNEKIFKIVSKIYGLNPNIEKNKIYSFMLKVNDSSCEDPLNTDEVLDICNKVLAKEPILYSNKQKSYIFNTYYELTGRERTSIAVSESNKKRGYESTCIIYDCLVDWDFDKLGKITYDKIADKVGMSRVTVARKGKNMREIIKNLNNSLVKSL